MNTETFALSPGDVCDDAAGIIISYLPPDVCKALSRGHYIAEVTKIVSNGGAFRSVLEKAGGLFPQMAEIVLKSNPSLNIAVDTTNGFGDDVHVYTYLVWRLTPAYIDHVPYGIECQHLHSKRSGRYITGDTNIGEALRSGNFWYTTARYRSNAAIRLAIILEMPAEFYGYRIDAAIDEYPDLAAYDCYSCLPVDLREAIDYAACDIDRIIDTYDVRKDDIISLGDDIKTIRGFRRAMDILYRLSD